MTAFNILTQTQRQRVSDGEMIPIFKGCETASRLLVLIWSQLGDFDSMEYAWWLRREADRLRENNITIRAVGIGDRAAGTQFCEYTGFPNEWLFTDSNAEIHRQLNLYAGLAFKMPGLSPGQNAWLNLMLMCAGIGSPGTLAEVFRGYKGDRTSPQLIGEDEVVQAAPLPPLKGAFFNLAGGSGFQRPFELATLRLRNMAESLGKWNTYVPDSTYLTQRGGTFLFDDEGNTLYEYRDRGILTFSETMSQPLSFLDELKMKQCAIP
ncbi:MAG: peroxiredoxin-like family protein [Cyanobacteria bacterium P01_F01_bin.150]